MEAWKQKIVDRLYELEFKGAAWHVKYDLWNMIDANINGYKNFKDKISIEAVQLLRKYKRLHKLKQYD
jgi:hypothetical protein